MAPGGPPKFVPKLYGFKIFGMRGSKHELRFDSKGNTANEEEIKQVLRRRVVPQFASVGTSGGSVLTCTFASTTMREEARSSEDEKMNM